MDRTSLAEGVSADCIAPGDLALRRTEVGDREKGVNFFEYGSRNPCRGCGSGCCRLLILRTYRVRKWSDLDFLRYVVQFRGIVLFVTLDGGWKVLLQRPCSLLDAESSLCTVHGSLRQPEICRQYNPYDCWYRRILTESDEGPGVFLEVADLDRVFELARFDSLGSLMHLPGLAKIRDALGHRSAVRKGDDPGTNGRSATDDGRRHPCRGCDDLCCQNLFFFQRTPRNRRDIDYLRYATGFPGVSVLPGRSRWMLRVESSCRHHANDACLCRADGKIERSRHCEFLSAKSCGIAGWVRGGGGGFDLANPEEFAPLIDATEFDAHDRIVRFGDPRHTGEGVESSESEEASDGMDAPAIAPAT